MSEHDLREGSKPRCPKCGNYWTNNHGYFGNVVTCRFCRVEFVCNSVSDFAQFFPIAAILEENQRLREQVCIYKDMNTDAGKIAKEKLRATEAENQKLAKELKEADKEDDKNFAAYCRESKAREAAESKLGEMREALTVLKPHRDGGEAEAIEANLQFVEQHVRKRRCDAEAVSECVRCQTVHLAKVLRQIVAALAE